MARMPAHVSRLRLSENPAGRTLLLATFSLIAIGVVIVYSATATVTDPGAWFARSTIRQMLFAVAAMGVLLVGWRLDYRWLRPGLGRRPLVTGLILVGSLLAATLVFVPGIGREMGGYHRWIRVGPSQYGIGLQPSELIKLALPIFLVAWLTREKTDIKSFRHVFLPAMVLIGVCVGLVVTQDLGTAVVIAVSAGATLLLVGVPWGYLLSMVPVAAGGFCLLVLSSPSRLGRITAMFDIWSTTNRSSYQPRQSLLAILTGGWFGKGPGNGTVKLGYLPEDSTDFVFSALCEEWGFVGAAALMGLWLVWMWRAWQTAMQSGDRFGRALAGALGFTIALQAALHVGIDTVILPPTGMSLPFVSAGGTSLLLMAAATVLIVSVSAHPNAPERVVAS